MQHMVEPVVLPGALHDHDVVGLLQHTDGGVVAVGIAADGAARAFGNVVAQLAELDGAAHRRDGSGELLGFFEGHAEKVKGDALGGFGADAGQAFQLVHQARHRRG